MVKDLYGVFHASFGFKIIVGLCITVVGFFFDPLLVKIYLAVLVLLMIDCLLGYIRAMAARKAVTSRVMYRYMWKFTGYAIASSSLFLMNNSMPEIVQPLTLWLDNFALAFFAIHETISIIEHLNEIGVPMPTKILGNLRKVKNTVDKTEYVHEDVYHERK